MPRHSTKRKRENPPGKYPGRSSGTRRKTSELLNKAYDWHAGGIGIDPTILLEGERLAQGDAGSSLSHIGPALGFSRDPSLV